jgi:hypothetical protein
MAMARNGIVHGAETMPDDEVPVLVLDLNEAEADKVLLTLDPLASMASADSERLDALLDSVRTDDPAIQVLLDDLRAQEGLLLENLSDLVDPDPQVDEAASKLQCRGARQADDCALRCRVRRAVRRWKKRRH